MVGQVDKKAPARDVLCGFRVVFVVPSKQKLENAAFRTDDQLTCEVQCMNCKTSPTELRCLMPPMWPHLRIPMLRGPERVNSKTHLGMAKKENV